MTGPLIDVAELRNILEEVSLLDVRYRMGGPPGQDEFAAGHIPGAAYVDLDEDLADQPGVRGRHPLPEPFRFVGAMRAAGVSNHRPVVVYDDWQGRAAARCWWLLRHYGHDDVRVLDGGWSHWVGSGGEVSRAASPIEPGDFSGAPGRLAVVGPDDVLGFEGTVIDARNPERYRGEVEPVDPVAGHIPGAVNLATGSNLTEDGLFRPSAELADLYPSGDVAAYCGSGVTATHDLLALAVIGREGALYPGSWSEWVSPEGPMRPVETTGD